MMLVDRDPEREVRHLTWRIRIFGAGAILGLAGIFADLKWLVWVAIGVLCLGFVLRFLPDSEGDAAEDDRAG